jgi:hypothetical protein
MIKEKRKKRNQRRRLRRRRQKESQQPKKLTKGQVKARLTRALRQKRKYQRPDGVDYLAMLERREKQ